MPHIAGSYYHVYNRGCNREPIFRTDDNYRYLLSQMRKFLVDSSVAIIAYCLMPNHYHLLLRSDTDDGIPRFVQRLFNSYSQAFNRQQKRHGTIFEGRARSIWVDDERYLLLLCRYIHLNPVAAGLVVSPEAWPYSNYLEWINKRQGILCDREFVETYFPRPGVYAEFVGSSPDNANCEGMKQYVAE